MRIISGNICSQCCFCVDDSDGYGMCCKDDAYRHININQGACSSFCGDGDDISYIIQCQAGEDIGDVDDDFYYE